MPILTYNGLTFRHILTEPGGFRQEMVHDETQTDLMYLRISLTCTAFLESGRPVDSTVDPKAAETVARIRRKFMVPRKAWSFTANGQELIPQDSAKPIDAKSGPIPLEFSPQILTEGGFAISIRIMGHYAESGTNVDGGKILSHRWEDTADINLHHLTRKTRSGRVTVSSREFTSGGKAIDQLRETLLTPSMLPGFVREGQTYTLSRDGLTVNYNVIDMERFRIPPFPATDAKGTLRISAQVQGTPGRFATANLTLYGPKIAQATQAVLIRLASKILDQKMKQSAGGGKFFVQSASFGESLYENQVDVTLTGRLVPANPRTEQIFNVLANIRGIGIPPAGSEPGTFASDPGTRGTAGLEFHAAAYQDPRLSQKLDRKTNLITDQEPGADQVGVGLIPGG